MISATKRRSGVLMVVALVGCAAAGGCKRADDTGSAANPSGASAPATPGGASGLTGPAVNPAPAPPQGASG